MENDELKHLDEEGKKEKKKERVCECVCNCYLKRRKTGLRKNERKSKEVK